MPGTPSSCPGDLELPGSALCSPRRLESWGGPPSHGPFSGKRSRYAIQLSRGQNVMLSFVPRLWTNVLLSSKELAGWSTVMDACFLRTQKSNTIVGSGNSLLSFISSSSFSSLFLFLLPTSSSPSPPLSFSLPPLPLLLLFFHLFSTSFFLPIFLLLFFFTMKVCIARGYVKKFGRSFTYFSHIYKSL